MKLYVTHTSPFVRKVLVCAHELGLADRIEQVLLRPSPLEPNAELSRANPLNKIPALVLADGSGLYDSRVICEYLDGLGSARVMPTGPARLGVLRRQALADGILDAAILVFYERQQRPVHLHWDAWLQGQTTKAKQGLDALESEAHELTLALDHCGEGALTLDLVSVGVTLGWLDFRGAVGDFREGRPALDKLAERLFVRPSMMATAPRG